MLDSICDYNQCTGCYACQSICPHNCITLVPDKNGELHPLVREEACIECGLCVKICPANHDVKGSDATDCFVAWDNSSDEERKLSASGGIAALMYRYFIEELHGVGYGVMWNEALQPHFGRLDSSSELVNFKGSKYVQAFVGDSYRKVKSDLLNGKWVLFVGTPCQIAGLRSYLRQDYEKLVTCDLLCHGVPPYEYLKQELGTIKENVLQQAQNCRFRGNDKYNYCLTLWDKNNNLLYAKKAIRSSYLFAFLISLTLRECCYKCKYASRFRVSDMTIGDFIGLKKVPLGAKKQNVSVCVPITDKGVKLWGNLCKTYSSLHCEKRPYSEAVAGGLSFREPAKRNSKRDKFLVDFQKHGWKFAIRKALWKSMLRNFIISKLRK